MKLATIEIHARDAYRERGIVVRNELREYRNGTHPVCLEYERRFEKVRLREEREKQEQKQRATKLKHEQEKKAQQEAEREASEKRKEELRLAKGKYLEAPEGLEMLAALLFFAAVGGTIFYCWRSDEIGFWWGAVYTGLALAIFYVVAGAVALSYRLARLRMWSAKHPEQESDDEKLQRMKFLEPPDWLATFPLVAVFGTFALTLIYCLYGWIFGSLGLLRGGVYLVISWLGTAAIMLGVLGVYRAIRMYQWSVKGG